LPGGFRRNHPFLKSQVWLFIESIHQASSLNTGSRLYLSNLLSNTGPPRTIKSEFHQLYAVKESSFIHAPSRLGKPSKREGRPEAKPKWLYEMIWKNG